MNDTISKGDKKEEKAMSGMKKTLSIFLAVLMLFSSLPFGVFAESEDEPKATQSESEETKADEKSAEEKTDEKAEDNSAEKSEQEDKKETDYKIGEEYTIDGVKYKINTNGTAEVLGGTDDAPSRVEILSYLGDFPVIKLEGYFRGKATKELIVPETVKEIRSLHLTNVEKIEIKGDNVSIDNSLGSNKCLTDVKENWKYGRLVISGYLILSEEKGEVVLGPDIKGTAASCFKNALEIAALTILNPNFYIKNFTSGISPIYYGLKGSTVEKFAESRHYTFVTICDCEGAEPVEATKSYCDGTVGYKADRWCGKCGLWQCGHKINDEISHFDENGDGVCDNCGLSADAVPVGRNSIKNKFTWTLYDEGTLLIIGSGTLSNREYYSKQPWSYYSKNSPIKKVIISGNVNELEGNLFENCQDLESVVLPDTVEKISEGEIGSSYAFNKCISLKEINWPKSLTYIGNYAFSDCKSLEKVELNDNFRAIGKYAFSGCASIKSLQFKGEIKSINMGAFSGCTSLESVEFNDALQLISYYAFEHCSSLKSIKCSENIKKIGKWAFRECASLESVQLNDALETIEGEAFAGCVALKDLTLGGSLKTIGESAFYGCAGITEIRIPKSVEIVLKKAFYNCTSLKDIAFEGEHTDVGEIAFHNTAASNDPNNIKDGMFYISNYLIEEVTPGTVKLVIGPEITHVAKFQNLNTRLREMVVCNPQCEFSYSVPQYIDYSTFDYINVVIKSSSNAKVRRLKCKEFIPICVCGGGKTVPESFSYCDGTIGYTEGVRCDNCDVWLSGHEIKAEINHIYKNEDKICDYCKQSVDIKIIDQGKCGKDISWHLTEDGKLFIDGTGDMFNYGSGSASPWEKYRETDTVKSVEFSGTVTSIGNFAFYNLSSIKDIKFSHNIMMIGDFAFGNCSGIEKVILTQPLYKIGASAFVCCTALKSVSLNEDLTFLGDYAFRNCTSLKSIFIPENCQNIGEGVFSLCTELENVEFAAKYVSVPDKMFVGCKKLTNIKVKRSLEKIGALSFSACESLKSFRASSLSEVGEYAFKNCSSLESFDAYPNEIDNGAFYGCKSLKNMKISSWCSYIGSDAFADCSALESINIPKKIKLINARTFKNCVSLKNVTFSGSIKEIGGGAFSGCSALESFVVPQDVENIGGWAFASCTSLKSIAIPENVKYIGEGAFASCASLKNITIPVATNEIYAKTFNECNSLETVTFENTRIKIAAPTKNKKNANIVYPTIPSGATVISENGSTAEQYADRYGLRFTPSVQKEVSSIVIDKMPNKRMYFIGRDTELSAEGAVLTVKYEDGSTVEIRNTYTVDWKDADIAKAGSYCPVLKYGEGEIEYEIRVLSSGTNEYIGIPKERFVEINCPKDEWVPFSFTPTETREYHLHFDYSSGSIDINDEDGNKVQFQTSYYYKKDVSEKLEAGKTYKIYIKATDDLILRIYEFDDIKFKLLEDGTYSAERWLKGGDIVIPSEYGGVPVTKIEDNFSGNAGFGGVTSVTIPEGIKEIGKRAFYKFSGEINIPSTVEVVGDEAFCETKIGEVALGPDLKHIGKRAFDSCNDLVKVKIAASNAYFDECAFNRCYNLKKVILPNEMEMLGKSMFSYCFLLEEVVGCGKINKIGESAFLKCRKLKAENIIAAAHNIEKQAFAYCSAVEKVRFNDSITDISCDAFAQCNSIEEVVLGDNIKIVERGAFNNCRKLSKVTFNDKLSEIGRYAFIGTMLKEINLPASLKAIEYEAFAVTPVEEVSLPEAIEILGPGCFRQCSNLSKVTLPKKIKEIGSFCFEGCSSLETVIAYDDIEKINDRAFNACVKLKNIDFGSNVKSIGNSAFCGCKFLESLTFAEHSEIKEIGGYAFAGCDNLKNIDFADTARKIGNNAFSGCVSIESVSFTESVKIGEYAFSACSSLKSVNFNGNKTEMDYYVFSGCKSLKEIEIPSGSKLGNEVFRNCTSLEKATINDNVNYARAIFEGCSGLKEIYIRSSCSANLVFGKIPDDVTFFAYEGSNVEKFAKANNYAFRKLEGHTHKLELKYLTEKKCNSYCSYVYVCSCGYTTDEELKHITDHIYDTDFTVDQKPTCVKSGLKSRHCKCGYSRKDVTIIPPTGHTEVIDIPAVPPTKTTPGYTHQSHCSVCGEVLVKRTKIDPGEYDVSVGNGVTTAEKTVTATVKANGVHMRITFAKRKNIYASEIDKTVIYKVGEIKLTKTEFAYNGKTQRPSVTVKNSKGAALKLGTDYKVT